MASAPEVWLSAVAQHTTRIRIGHGVQAGGLKHADICDSLRRFGREVIPKLR